MHFNILPKTVVHLFIPWANERAYFKIRNSNSNVKY